MQKLNNLIGKDAEMLENYSKLKGIQKLKKRNEKSYFRSCV